MSTLKGRFKLKYTNIYLLYYNINNINFVNSRDGYLNIWLLFTFKINAYYYKKLLQKEIIKEKGNIVIKKIVP